MINEEVEEDEKATVARFIGELNQEITNIIELHHYENIEDMLHMQENMKKKAQENGRRQRHRVQIYNYSLEGKEKPIELILEE